MSSESLPPAGVESDPAPHFVPGVGAAALAEAECRAKAAAASGLDDRPRQRGRRFGSLRELRAFVSAILRRIESDMPEGEPLDLAAAKTMLHGATVLASLINGDLVERRISELERLCRRGN
jgi:hypothetical protein